jgi:sortase B
MGKHSIDKEKTTQKKSKIMLVIIFLIFALVFIYSSIKIGIWLISNGKQDNLEKNLYPSVITIKGADRQAQPEKIEVNFKKLKEINADTVAWIRIKDTNINYPIVKTNNNNFYLEHDFNKSYNTCGSIFLEHTNNENFVDQNTIIYGHNIKSGKMFADLNKIHSNQLGKNIVVEIYLPDGSTHKYRVVSSYAEAPRDNMFRNNFTNQQLKENFIKTTIRKSNINYGITPDYQKNVITLYTCTPNGKDRVIVHAIEE